MKISKSSLVAVVLNFLLPGLGHVYWKEFVFGLFVFLITLLGVILFLVSFFLDLPFWVEFFLFALPIVFYLFTFLDLLRIVKARLGLVHRTERTAWIFLTVGLAYQLLSPVAPANFIIRNAPVVVEQPDSRLSPIFKEGEILKINPLAYSVNLFFLNKPLLYSLPRRYDMVAVVDDNGNRQYGMVLGLPTEQVEMITGVLVINDVPEVAVPAEIESMLTGDCPLTYLDSYSILVATLNLGVVDAVYTVSMTNLEGKVSKLF